MDTKGLITEAKPVITAHEGERFRVYKDTMGIPTIGIGFNLLDPDARQLCVACGADYGALLRGLAELTPEQSNYLYQQSALDVLEWLTVIFPAYFTYSLNRQIALLDMGYNLGEPRFKGFRMMISAILSVDWAQAAEQALRSEWAAQVGHRATQDAAWLSEG